MRKTRLSDNVLTFILFASLALFLVGPLLTVIVDSVLIDGKIDFSYYIEFFKRPHYIECLQNSFLLAAASVAVTSLIGIPLAYIISRYDIPGKNFIRQIVLTSSITPPFIGSLAFIKLFGKYGMLNTILMDLKLVDKPSMFLFGFWGLVLVETLHLFPLVFLYTEAAFSKVDKDLEEVGEIHGMSGFGRFFRITMPLAFPGYVQGAYLVFIFAFSDWATPIMLMQHKYLATEVATGVRSVLDVRLYRLGLAGTGILTTITIMLLVIQRWYVERKKYLLKGFGRTIRISRMKKVVCIFFCAFVVFISLSSPIAMLLVALSRGWILTVLPTTWTLDNFQYVFAEAFTYIQNSLVFSTLALLFGIGLGIAIVYVMTRTEVFGKGTLDAIQSAVISIPGIVLGVGYMLLFGRPFLGFSLARSWLVMPVIICIRRLPYMIRPTYGGFVSISREQEEVAYVLGTSRSSTLLKVTLPQIWNSIFAGALTMFVFSLLETSATYFLYKPGWTTTTLAILNLAESIGFLEKAAALSVLLILVIIVCNYLANRLGRTLQ